MNACVMSQLGGCSKSRRISRIRGSIEVPIQSLVGGLIVVYSRYGLISFMLTNRGSG